MNVLEPVDLGRCQAEIVERRPFAVGGTHVTRRCENVPTYVAIENTPTAGQYGSMSLCDDCRLKMHAALGVDHATTLRIREIK